VYAAHICARLTWNVWRHAIFAAHPASSIRVATLAPKIVSAAPSAFGTSTLQAGCDAATAACAAAYALRTSAADAGLVKPSLRDEPLAAASPCWTDRHRGGGR